MSIAQPSARGDPAEDARFMSLALTLGRRTLGSSWPNPAVGAVVVQRGPEGPVIVGRGWTQPGGRPHAEPQALQRAGEAARGATIYTTLEPCSHYGKSPPCVEAISQAGIARVVSAIEDPNLKVAGQGHDFLRARGVGVDLGVCAEQARRDHAGHIRRIREGRPHVTLKLAVSRDGKAALPGRRPAQITSEAARDRAHMMRAMNDAILIGVGTALADDPALTCRLPGMADRSPNRVILDSALRLRLDSKLVKSAHEVPVWVFASVDAPRDAEERLRDRGVEVFHIDAHEGRLELEAVVRLLSSLGITRLMVEGGPMVAASFLKADLVDEAALFRAPMAIGADGVDALHGMPIDAFITLGHLRAFGSDPIGPDRLDIYERP